MKKYFYFILLICPNIEIISQIGIGNPSPNPGSILDIRHQNTENKPLILPHTSINSPFTNEPSGTLLFNNTNKLIYYTTNSAGDFNALSPWVFKNPFDFIYFDDILKNVGIGTTSSRGKLTIYSNSNISTSSSTDGILFIGDKVGSTYDNFLKIDKNEIMVHEGINVDPELTLLKHGGTVKVGTNVSSPSDNQTDLNVTGRILEDGHELVPTGTIVMHYSTSVPAGWGLCNGSSYPKVDGTGLIDSPDLSNRFILAGNISNLRTTGGEDFVTLTKDQLPQHNHNVSINSTGSSHSHNLGSRSILTSAGGATSSGKGADGSQDDNDILNRGGGAHTHPISQSIKGNDNPHENRPPFHALVFIMKL